MSHAILKRHRSLILVLAGLLLTVALSTPATAANAMDVVMLRAGKGIIAVLSRACGILTQIGNRSFSAAVASTAFQGGNRKLRITIAGSVQVPGRYVRGKVMASLNQDCPLPYRPECQGIFRLTLPANAATVDANAWFGVPFRLDLGIDVEQTLKVLTMMGLGFGLKQVDLFPNEAFLNLINNIPSQNLREVLVRFFPGFVGFLEKRTISRAVDEILSDGRLTGGRALQGLGLDELVGFAVNFGLGMAQMTAAGFAKGAVAMGAGAAAVAMPGLSTIAVGAILEVVAVKLTGALVDLGKDQFDRGIYRDRFAKIDAFLLGTWEPGRHNIPWLENAITQEAKQDQYKTIEKLVIYLRAKDPLKRGWWNPLHPRLRAPLVFRSQQEGSWLAARYLAMWDLLFGK
jgi:hypothetical protein